MYPEKWEVLDRAHGQVWVQRTVTHHPDSLTTTGWKLAQIDGAWKCVEIIYSRPNEGLDQVHERTKVYPRGIKLTDSRVDRILRGFANV